jgi:formiminotetrahydrofolate cyclodeaminase
LAYAKQEIGEFAAALGEQTPAPASGCAIAVAAALAAALVELTARFSDDEATVDEAVRLRVRLLELADEDAEAYAAFMRSRSDETRRRTIEVPAELADRAAHVAQLGERLEREGNERLVGDAAAAVLIARAAAGAAARLVEINRAEAD